MLIVVIVLAVLLAAAVVGLVVVARRAEPLAGVLSTDEVREVEALSPAFKVERISRDSWPAPAPPTWLETVLKKRIVVHLRDGLTIAGTLMEQTADGIILRAARLLGDDKRETPMAGETFVPRENIAFCQLDE